MESNDKVPSTELDADMRSAIARIDEKTFTDRTSGHVFRRYKYFDFEVIQDIETGFINAGKFVRDVSERNFGEKRRKQFSHFKVTEDYNNALDYCADELTKKGGKEISATLTKAEIEAYMLREFGPEFGNDVRGTYVPFRVFQLVALWADKRHKLAILELIENINENANSKQMSPYDEIKELNERLTKETEELKARVVESEAIIQMKETLIQKLTTPVNILASPEAIYASPKGGNEFQLRHQKQPISDDSPKPDRIRYINVINASAVKETAMKILIKQGLVFSLTNRNRLISRDNLELVFSIIDKISKNEPIDIPLQEYKHAFLMNALNNLRLRVQTGPIVGKIYERNYELENENVIPWEIVPIHIINKYNETNSDHGFNAVILNENEDDIIEAIQIKHSSRNDYVREEELRSFIIKCQEPRYAHVQKRLILHNCRISQTLITLFESLGVVIETIRE